MTAFTLLVDKPVHLEMTGKFVAPLSGVDSLKPDFAGL